jgi:NADH-quinone oxidoreductase subunit E
MFSAETLEKFAREVAKYPPEHQSSAVMACLALAQEEKGWLSPESIEAVADYLAMPPIAAYEVASFYNMYDLKPVGKYKITVCTNLPCALSGGYHAGEYVKQKLCIDYGDTTADGKFTLKEGECMGACGDAPVFIVNNRTMCSHMLPEQIDKLLEECK